jgi:hypothetical protein
MIMTPHSNTAAHGRCQGTRSTGVAALVAATFAVGLVALADVARSQESDIVRTPNNAGAGIQKSLEEQIGHGRGDIFMPGSSRFLIARDPFRAIARGRQIFSAQVQHL